MNLDHLDGRRRPGLAIHRADSKVAGMLARLPDGYRKLLSQSDGIELASGALIYGSRDLVERNQTYQVSAYLPTHAAIGDDGGGQMFLLRHGVASPVLRIDMGAIGSMTPDVMAKSLEDWVERGCPLKTSADLRAARESAVVDVYLEAIPGGKLTNFIAMKTELGLDLSMADLKAMAGRLPACLLKDVSYAYFRARCDALNARFGACLTLRTK